MALTVWPCSNYTSSCFQWARCPAFLLTFFLAFSTCVVQNSTVFLCALSMHFFNFFVSVKLSLSAQFPSFCRISSCFKLCSGSYVYLFIHLFYFLFVVNFFFSIFLMLIFMFMLCWVLPSLLPHPIAIFLLSPYVILCGWLGSEHQLANKNLVLHKGISYDKDGE